METARRLIGQNLNATGFDTIRGYIFGGAIAERSGFRPVGGVPTFGGYAVGYHVVQAYLKRSGKTIEEATLQGSTPQASPGYRPCHAVSKRIKFPVTTP